jgi:hypothetical protein
LADDTFGDADLLGRDRNAGLQRFNFRARGIQLRFADHLFFDQLLTPTEGQFRLAQPGLVLRRTTTRRFQLRLADAERRAHLRGVQSGEHLAFANCPPFLNEDFEDLAGDLR